MLYKFAIIITIENNKIRNWQTSTDNSLLLVKSDLVANLTVVLVSNEFPLVLNRLTLTVNTFYYVATAHMSSHNCVGNHKFHHISDDNKP